MIKIFLIFKINNNYLDNKFKSLKGLLIIVERDNRSKIVKIKYITIIIFAFCFLLLRPYFLQESGLLYSNDDEGYFAVNLSEREIELLESGRSRLIINVPTSEEHSSKSMGDFPFEKLSAEKSKAGILTIERPERKPLLLTGKSIPGFEGIDIEFDIEQARSKMVLVCFFDMHQRPSRNCLIQLANQADQLREKGIIVIAIHAAKVEQVKLNEWIKEHTITFPVGTIKGQEEQIRFDWGVKSLPWLILNDTKHIIRATGFRVDELNEKIGDTTNVEL